MAKFSLLTRTAGPVLWPLADNKIRSEWHTTSFPNQIKKPLTANILCTVWPNNDLPLTSDWLRFLLISRQCEFFAPIIQSSDWLQSAAVQPRTFGDCAQGTLSNCRNENNPPVENVGDFSPLEARSVSRHQYSVGRWRLYSNWFGHVFVTYAPIGVVLISANNYMNNGADSR